MEVMILLKNKKNEWLKAKFNIIILRFANVFYAQTHWHYVIVSPVVVIPISFLINSASLLSVLLILFYYLYLISRHI